jgi:hypothetical protein
MHEQRERQWNADDRSARDEEVTERRPERRSPGAVTFCPGCHFALEESLVASRGDPSRHLKSCPRCSMRQGLHVFYPFDAFRERAMEDGWTMVDPWCESCVRRVEPIPATRTCRVPAEQD